MNFTCANILKSMCVCLLLVLTFLPFDYSKSQDWTQMEFAKKKRRENDEQANGRSIESTEHQTLLTMYQVSVVWSGSRTFVCLLPSHLWPLMIALCCCFASLYGAFHRALDPIQWIYECRAIIAFENCVCWTHFECIIADGSFQHMFYGKPYFMWLVKNRHSFVHSVCVCVGPEKLVNIK